MHQLASHMAGLPNNVPPTPQPDWPKSLNGAIPPYSGEPIPTIPEILKAVSELPLIAPPYTFPSYSNTGFALLGASNVIANRKEGGDSEPSTHAALLKRDVFDKLGMNGSSFLATEENRALVAVASTLPIESVSFPLFFIMIDCLFNFVVLGHRPNRCSQSSRRPILFHVRSYKGHASSAQSILTCRNQTTFPF